MNYIWVPESINESGEGKGTDQENWKKKVILQDLLNNRPNDYNSNYKLSASCSYSLANKKLTDRKQKRGLFFHGIR